MALSAIHGYPRIGARRELKRATEQYWDNSITRDELEETGRTLRLEAWRRMSDAGIDLIPSNTFSFYDHVLDTTAMVGAMPPRYRSETSSTIAPDQARNKKPDEHPTLDLDLYFAMARGAQDPQAGLDVTAMEMTKWFDTNYHYLVPELNADSSFELGSTKPLDEYLEARDAGIETIPVLLGPLTYLLLSKTHDDREEVDHSFNKLSLLPQLLEVYSVVLSQLRNSGARWVQFDEPALVLDRSPEELTALSRAYEALSKVAGTRDGQPQNGGIQLLVQTYFGDVDNSYPTLANLPVSAIGMDFHRGRRNLDILREHGLPGDKHLVAGIVDGRNVWINNLSASLELLRELQSLAGNDRLIVSSSCSLMHVPVELEREDQLDSELRSWLAFANQKIEEVSTLARAIDNQESANDSLATNDAVLKSRLSSNRANDRDVRKRVDSTTEADYRRLGTVEERRAAQREQFALPLFPTTTIGSFPQTPELRQARSRLQNGEFTESQYDGVMQDEIAKVIELQEEIGLDVLVHGEPERNDMVEYFGEQLQGFAFTRFGWVQSYGSRYVKPPIIFGDVARPAPMTVRWALYAQSLTERPVKGMLTGPVTILNWSFARDDQPRSETCRQIALAIRDEVTDLEAVGISVIQIDEPALREGLPLRKSDWTSYLDWAVPCFRLSTSAVRNETQIQTHMCYSEFNEVIAAISELDADVLLIENARSGAELLEVFRDFQYDKQIGPGVYDIHSPRIAPTQEMIAHLHDATTVLDRDLLWVNPDCGLKTRRYEETVPSLQNLVKAAREMRGQTTTG